ncbi:uncharacterized protein BYT42DRAFT_504089, partial [Radiomyces spectabilis]|uniref:uncharacterized protein n=1 Tax=Radiomyces spectabilis TaxID=64574 RepID=UPI00221F1555
MTTSRSTISSQNTQSTEPSRPVLVELQHCCYVCSKRVKDAINLRRHLLNVHQRHLPSIPHGKRRFDTGEYVFVKFTGYSSHDDVKHRFACPSCLEHFGEKREYIQHVEATHL